MRLSYILAALLAAMWAAACPSVADAPTWPHTFQFKGTDVAVHIPNGVDVVPRKNLPDFDVYDFKSGGQEILGAYVGFNPDLSPLPGHKQERVVNRKADGFAITDTSYAPNKDGLARQTTVEDRLKNGNAGSPPMIYVQFFYDGDSTAQAALADRIIASMSRVPSH